MRAATRLLLTTDKDTSAPDLADLGVPTTIVTCDPGDRHALAELLNTEPVTAVVHIAELLEEGPLDTFTPDQLERVLRVKATAAWNLHELAGDVEAFVMFSSITATLGGGVGVGAYAAANAYLDALAQYRRAHGQPATALAWGAWANPTTDPTEAALEQDRRDRLIRRGIPAIKPELALDALRDALDHDDVTALIADVDWDRYLRVFTANRPSPLVGELPEVKASHRASSVDKPSRLDRLAGLTAPEQHRLLAELVRAEIAAVLGHAGPDAVDAQRGFLELGMDSLTTVELRNRLNTATGLRLPARAVLDARTPDALARHLHAELSGQETTGNEPAGMFSSLFGRALELGQATGFTDLLATAARFRPVFDVPGSAETPAAVTLATGTTQPALFCFPTVLATSGPHQYARIAAGLDDRTISALTLPGYTDGERLPATLDALVEATAEAVRQQAGGGPFALVGYSSGGILAHAVAERLEEHGVHPDAVVLLDTYLLLDQTLPTLGPVLMDGMAARLGELAPLDDVRLTAMGGYLRLLAGWEPGPIAARTLLVRASEPVPGWPERDDWRCSWRQAHTAVDVPGDHFTVIEEHAASTATAIDTWLREARG